MSRSLHATWLHIDVIMKRINLMLVIVVSAIAAHSDLCLGESSEGQLFAQRRKSTAQSPARSNENIWKPIGCLYNSFAVEGLNEKDLMWSFPGDGIRLDGSDRRITSGDISTLIKQMTASVGL